MYPKISNRLTNLRGDGARRASGRVAGLVLMALVTTVGSQTAQAAIFTVSNTNDSGAGSLRKAISDANGAAGADEIRFNLGASKTITLLSALPALATPIDLNATSQPGWTTTPLVVLDGHNVANDGLFITGTGCKVRGLVINGFGGNGIAIAGGDITTVQGNWIGLNAAGNAAVPNGSGIAVYSTSVLNQIGGTTAAQRNVVSGNTYGGIVLSDASGSSTISGNYVGTDATGNAAIGNQSAAIRIFSSNNLIGGTTAGAGNVIGGNAAGLIIEGTGNNVQGNTIGLNATGTAALPNNGGISVYAGPNLIGSTDPAGANVVAGNNYDGIYLGPQASGVTVVGNRVGTNRAGTVAFGNAVEGVRVDGDGNTVGGATAAHGNLLANNGYNGVAINGEGNAVLNNLIGLDVTGTIAMGNGSGVSVYGPLNTIGAPGQGNTIAANDYHGVILYDAGASGTVVQANRIGTRPDGVTAAGNTYYGIQVHNAFDNLIGGTAVGEGNVIANNGYYGVFVDSGDGNAILGNAIAQNGFWGIDLAPYGVAKNDPGDVDLGPNRNQNYPVLTAVTGNGGSTTFDGALSSSPNASFTVELFSSPSCDPSGFGEGKAFVGRFTVQTDAPGKASFHKTLGVTVADPFVTATATSDAKSDTSEFSPCVPTTGAAPGVLQFSQDQFVGYEVEPDGVVTITVTRALGATGTVTVDYATSSVAATDGVDYDDLSGTLTFLEGEVVKTFDVPVYQDDDTEGQENITLTLSSPGGGASLGAQATSKIALIDCSPTNPTAYVSDASVVEGPSGGTVHLEFTISLSEHTDPITIYYGTVDGTAIEGEDYDEVSGHIDFAVGELAKVISVPVHGDGVTEGNETVFMIIYGVYNGTLTDGVGEGTIYDADAAGAPALCTNGGLITKPKIVVNDIGDGPGNEVVKVRGKLKFPGGQPAGFSPLDALNRGAQILIEDLGADGAPLWELSHRTDPVPAGALDDVCTAGMLDGWTVNGNQKKYVYANESGAVPNSCGVGSAHGLRLFRLLDRRATFTKAIEFFARTRPTTIADPVGPLRMTIVLAADDTVGQSGVCGTFSFDGIECQRDATGTRMVCK